MFTHRTPMSSALILCAALLASAARAQVPTLIDAGSTVGEALALSVEAAFQTAVSQGDEAAASCAGGIGNVLAEADNGEAVTARATWGQAALARNEVQLVDVPLAPAPDAVLLVLVSTETGAGLSCQLAGLSSQVPAAYSGIEMQKNDTTIAGDQYGTDTCHVDNYGTIDMEFKCEPKSKDWIDRVKKQYEGALAGAKPNGFITLTNRAGCDTATWNVMAWHVERFDFPTLNAKDDSQLIQYVTIRVEKFIKA